MEEGSLGWTRVWGGSSLFIFLIEKTLFLTCKINLHTDIPKWKDLYSSLIWICYFFTEREKPRGSLGTVNSPEPQKCKLGVWSIESLCLLARLWNHVIPTRIQRDSRYHPLQEGRTKYAHNWILTWTWLPSPYFLFFQVFAFKLKTWHPFTWLLISPLCNPDWFYHD